MKKEWKLSLQIGVTLLVMLLSFFVLSGHFAKPETFAEQIGYLDDKKASVLDLAGASTTASLAITALPGDVATPIAEKITDLSSYFLLIVGAIVLEKYLVTICTYASFRFLIPLGCLLLILYFIGRNDNYRKGAEKLFLFSLAISLLIPVSIGVSRLIEDTYESSTDNTVEALLQTTGEMTVTEPVITEEPVPAGSQNWWSKIWEDAKSTVTKVSENVVAVPEKITELCNRFIEAVAVLIITSCAIPIIVLLSFIWLCKVFLGLDLDLRAYRIRSGRRRMSAEPRE